MTATATMQRRLIRTKEAATYLSMIDWKLRRLIQEGTFPVVQDHEGGPFLLDVRDLDDYVDNNSQIREGRCGPKERSILAPATGIGEKTRGTSVFRSPRSGNLTEFRTRETTTQRMKEAGRHVCQVLCEPGNGKQLHTTVREPARLRNPG